MLDTIVTGGQVVTPQGVAEVDIAIADGRIAALAHPGVLSTEGAQVIDASGMIVLPGGIEPHTHIGIPVPEKWAGRPEVFTQPPEAATRAAAFGGVTTLLDFAGTLPVTALTTLFLLTPSCDRWSRVGRLSRDIATSTSRITTSWRAR